MATMKSYTNIEQSKVLSKILPLESADMYWFRNDTEIPEIYPNNMMKDSVSVTLPCWSLVALLGILPEHILRKDKVHNEMAYIPSYRWELTPSSIYYTDGNNIMDNIVARYDNKKNTIIDACYEMIMRLNELNLL